MSKLAVFTSLFALIVMTSVCPSWSVAQSVWQQPTSRKKASVEVGAKIFDRPGDDSNNPIIFDSVTNTTLLSQEQATDFGTDFGIEIIELTSRYRSTGRRIDGVGGGDDRNFVAGRNKSRTR